MEIWEQRLRADLDRLSGRVYSEEGVPMFLVCENLAPDEQTHSPASVIKTPLNTELTSDFGRDAATLQRVEPDARVTDVIKVVEVLADRDFALDGTDAEP